MFGKLKIKIKKNAEIFALSLLILITITSTTYYNYNKTKVYNKYKTTINNVYFKKTIDHVLNNLEPKFKKISHKVSDGETFVNILNNYQINYNFSLISNPLKHLNLGNLKLQCSPS